MQLLSPFLPSLPRLSWAAHGPQPGWKMACRRLKDHGAMGACVPEAPQEEFQIVRRTYARSSVALRSGPHPPGEMANRMKKRHGPMSQCGADGVSGRATGIVPDKSVDITMTITVYMKKECDVDKSGKWPLA